MKIEHRLQCLELKFVAKQPGCNPTLFIVVPQERQNCPFNSDSYRPTNDETEKYLKFLKDNGQCQDCKGACAIDWAPDGFRNHTLAGERSSSSSEPRIFWMFCADAEIPILTRRIMKGEIEPNS